MTFGIQDSTPIIDKMEMLFPQPSINPDDRVASFISELIEEFGDEWGNNGCSITAGPARSTSSPRPGASRGCGCRRRATTNHAAMIRQIRASMAERLWFVGSNEVTASQIETGFKEMVALLDRHLETRLYLFGGRPAYGDFGLWGQFYELWTDPTAGALIEGNAPHVLDWVHRMLWPPDRGTFRDLGNVAGHADADPRPPGWRAIHDLDRGQ